MFIPYSYLRRMKKTKIFFQVALLMAIVAVSSCKKKCTGGSGGGLNFIFYPQHHGKAIPNVQNHVDTIRVRYNSQDAPSSLSGYDAHFEGEPGTNYVRVTGLKCGDYYFFATGVDTSWDASHNT